MIVEFRARIFTYVLFIIVFFFNCKSEQKEQIVLKGEAFGTYMAIEYYGFFSNVSEIKDGISSIIAAVNKSLNTYQPDSDISKINDGDTTVVVDSMFQKVFLTSKDIFKNTQGYFDPTIGTLRNAYGFGDVKPMNNISAHKLDSMMQYVGFDKVELLKNKTIKKQYPEIYLDFNAIAKGYAVDLFGYFLKSQGINNFYVEVGGEVVAKGRKPMSEEQWKIGIEGIDSKVLKREVEEIIVLENKAIAGSGNFRQFWTDPISQQKYVHTINPITGKAEASNVLSAYVIANSCIIADGYATAFMAMGIDKSKALIAELLDIEVYLVYSNPMGDKEVFITSGFEELIINIEG